MGYGGLLGTLVGAGLSVYQGKEAKKAADKLAAERAKASAALRAEKAAAKQKMKDDAKFEADVARQQDALLSAQEASEDEDRLKDSDSTGNVISVSNLKKKAKKKKNSALKDFKVGG